MPKLIEKTIEENRKTRYASLLEAAVSIALENGSSALTITAVAKRAGISRAGVYEYFSSKEELVADLIIDELIDRNSLFQRRRRAPDNSTVNRWLHAITVGSAMLKSKCLAKLLRIGGLRSRGGEVSSNSIASAVFA